MISRSRLSTLPRSKRSSQISKSLPTTSCVPLYPAPWVLHTSMVNFSRLVADSTLWFKINFISSLGVSVWTNIPQHMTDCKVLHSLLYLSSPTSGKIQFDFRYKNEKEGILEPRKSSFLNSTVQVTPWHKDSAVTWKSCTGGCGESGVSEADSKSYAFPLDFTERDLKTGHRDAKGPMAPATVLTDNKFLL